MKANDPFRKNVRFGIGVFFTVLEGLLSACVYMAIYLLLNMLLKIYGSKEEIRARKSPETVDAPGFAPDASIPVTLYGPRWETRTPGLMVPNLCLNLQEALLCPLWRFPSLLRFLFGTLLPCSFQAPLSPFGICVGLNSVY